MSDHWSGERPRYGKTIKVEDGLKAKSTRGDIGATWWSRRFIEVLESFGMGGRLNRGRNYANLLRSRRESKTSGDERWARFRREDARFDTGGRRVRCRVVHLSARMLVALGRNRLRRRRTGMSCEMSWSRRWPER